MFEDLIDPGHRVIQCGSRRLVLDRPRIMAVVNVTPDSFSDGGRYFDPQRAIAHGLAQAAAGADVLDIGGESTRPGADPVSVQEELRRVIPVIQALAGQTRCVISVDTSKPEVMRQAVAAGAGLVNDVRALAAEDALATMAGLDAAVCLMHMQGEPGTMQAEPHYDDVVAQVHRFLAERMLACAMAGIDRRRILIDPGFGFGKTLEHNLTLLAGLQRFADLDAPLLAGLSRKRMIGELTGQQAPAERVAGSVAAALLAVERGAAIIRVHDVAASRDALAVQHALAQASARVPQRQPVAPSAPRWPDDE
ncbi:MAG: dihydropteroate synthase [Xanthomonadales bacterium]|nr:dihydropteroate synthase [Xanthomonadales bacterium]